MGKNQRAIYTAELDTWTTRPAPTAPRTPVRRAPSAEADSGAVRVVRPP